MRKIAGSAAIGCIAVAASAAMGMAVGARPVTAPEFATEAPCQATSALDPVCVARLADDPELAPPMGELPPAVTPNLGWTPLHAWRDPGPDFQHTAAEAETLSSLAPDGGNSHRLIQALLSLVGLLVLLHKRPT